MGKCLAGNACKDIVMPEFDLTIEECAAAARLSLAASEKRRAGDERGYRLDNYLFHFTIYRDARSPLLLSPIATLWLRRSPTMRDAQSSLPARGANLHDELPLALGQRDADRAASVLRENTEKAGAFLIDRLRFADDPEEATGLAALKPLPRRKRA
jgi:DNA-binding GntR family transcriptional regulator